MKDNKTTPPITSFVVKIVSRCNINCDYCYVYKHADQSYKKQPLRLSKPNSTHFAQRINEYLTETNIPSMSICLHGGEPLLAGRRHLEEFFTTLDHHLAPHHKPKIRLAIQTNGVLLTREFLDLFKKYNVGISISLDGPRVANDKHRLDHKQQSTYDKVIQALNLLQTNYPELFLGIIAVIDPTNNPAEIIDFFSTLNPPSFDLLFPDANHLVSPPKRREDPTIYENWIKEAYNYWHTNHRTLRLRMFKNIYDAMFGLPTESEFFGNGSISYLIMETDGTYHYSDLLKATFENATHLGLHIESSSIQDVINAPSLQGYQQKLLNENKCETCLKCPELHICGGGQIAHRYGLNGFDNPTTYCRETLSMIREARHLVIQDNTKELLSDPIRYQNDIMAMLFSDHSVYLLAAIAGLKVVTPQVSPYIQLGKQSTYQLSLHYLTKVYPNIAIELNTLLSTNEMQDLKTADPEHILDILSFQKFMFCQLYFDFEQTGLLLGIYKRAYCYRLRQYFAGQSDEKYIEALNTRELLLEDINSFSSSNAIELTFVNHLMDAFLPDQIVYKGNSYVCC